MGPSFRYKIVPFTYPLHTLNYQTFNDDTLFLFYIRYFLERVSQKPVKHETRQQWLKILNDGGLQSADGHKKCGRFSSVLHVMKIIYRTIYSSSHDDKGPLVS